MYSKLFSLLALPLALFVDVSVAEDPNLVTITFHAAAASYNLSIEADGAKHNTNNEINVSTVSLEVCCSFYYPRCTFYTNSGTSIPSPSSGTFDVGPPQPIDYVVCSPTAAFTDCVGECRTQRETCIEQTHGDCAVPYYACVARSCNVTYPLQEP